MMDAERGLLVLMGSGETSPTMVTLHRQLVAHLESDAGAVILETPYGFQVNRGDISSRAQEYFRRSVGLVATVLADTDADLAVDADPDAPHDQIRRAAWVFCGPGSPSYALRRWREQGWGQALADRVRRGRGVTVMASAAACTVGRAALPVYEVYKAGHPPVWLNGLDLLGGLGISVAVIPHYDNAEGGTHDTRFCYLGETRLAALEGHLPGDSAVLGIDEHTAVIIDLAADSARVWGRGVLTIRRRGAVTLIPSGTVVPLDRLRSLAAGTAVSEASGPWEAATEPVRSDGPSGGDGPVTLQEAVTAADGLFESARAARDAGRMVAAVLQLEAEISSWSGDTEEDEGGQEWARTVLRGMIRRFAMPAQQGMVEPELTLGRVIDPLLDLRGALRAQGAYDLADRLRASLAAGGVRIRDDARGSRWQLLPGEEAEVIGTEESIGSADNASSDRYP
ncbi:hypothetical protein [Streptomyces sp. SPB162]|uniref:hypothetical protein n=1 Tax=Streptomyces sp. SPB162 TaxID=2940560 RepID=UPI00240612DE|nr:hypothetical protein [Streptomyces sp. SPB162]MDF9816197.1 hypothetical protein [Streptomyces sp. SPB162]